MIEEVKKEINHYPYGAFYGLKPEQAQQVKDLVDIFDKLKEYIQNKIYEIEPKGTKINFNCEYDSEEDYIRGMKTKSRLETLKELLEILGDKENER